MPEYKFTTLIVPMPKQSFNPTFKKGKMRGYTDTKIKAYEQAIAISSMKHRPPEPLTGAIGADVKVFKPIPGYIQKVASKLLAAINLILRPDVSPDWDNYAKPIMDAIEKIYFINDGQIVDGRLRKYYSETPRIEVRIFTDVEDVDYKAAFELACDECTSIIETEDGQLWRTHEEKKQYFIEKTKGSES